MERDECTMGNLKITNSFIERTSNNIVLSMNYFRAVKLWRWLDGLHTTAMCFVSWSFLLTKNARITNGGRYSHKFGVDSTRKLLKTFTGQSSGYRLWPMLSLTCLPGVGIHLNGEGHQALYRSYRWPVLFTITWKSGGHDLKWLIIS